MPSNATFVPDDFKEIHNLLMRLNRVAQVKKSRFHKIRYVKYDVLEKEHFLGMCSTQYFDYGRC